VLIINETVWRHLGFNNPEEAIGKQIYHKGNNQTGAGNYWSGGRFSITKDYKTIYPIVGTIITPTSFGYFAVRVSVNERTAIARTIKGSLG
jgi:hypothetical protein